MGTAFRGVPGVYTGKSVTPRNIFKSQSGIQYAPSLITIDGTNSRDAANSPISLLRAGMILGKITASGKYAPSIIGKTAEALDSDETVLTVASGVAAELTRRIGATGTFKLTGPPTAAGTVRTLTATYSGISGNDVTITALGAKSTWTMTDTDGIDGGTFRLKVTLPSGAFSITAPCAWNIAAADLQAAIIATSVIGAGECTVTSDTSPRTVAFKEDLGNVILEIVTDLTADGGVYEGGITLAQTVVGVDGRFVTASLIQPTDGSETPLTVLDAEYGVDVADVDGTSIDQPLDRVLIAADFIAANLIDYPADASLKTWLKSQLRAKGHHYTFDDDRV